MTANSPQNKIIKILPLGDSITHGPEICPGGYRGFLEKILLKSQVPFTFVGSKTVNSEGMLHPHHEGHPGFSIEHLITGHSTEHSSAPPILETMERFSPDVILLLCGTNNIYFASPEDTADNMRRLLKEITRLKPNISIYLGTLLTIYPGPKPWGAVLPDDVGYRVEQLNLLLAKMVQELRNQQQNISLVEIHSCANNKNEFLEDGVHPGAKILSRMADKWAAALKF